MDRATGIGWRRGCDMLLFSPVEPETNGGSAARFFILKDLNDVIAAGFAQIGNRLDRLETGKDKDNGVDEEQVGPAVFEPAKIAEQLKIWW